MEGAGWEGLERISVKEHKKKGKLFCWQLTSTVVRAKPSVTLDGSPVLAEKWPSSVKTTGWTCARGETALWFRRGLTTGLGRLAST